MTLLPVWPCDLQRNSHCSAVTLPKCEKPCLTRQVEQRQRGAAQRAQRGRDRNRNRPVPILGRISEKPEEP